MLNNPDTSPQFTPREPSETEIQVFNDRMRNFGQGLKHYSIEARQNELNGLPSHEALATYMKGKATRMRSLGRDAIEAFNESNPDAAYAFFDEMVDISAEGMYGEAKKERESLRYTPKPEVNQSQPNSLFERFINKFIPRK